MTHYKNKALRLTYGSNDIILTSIIGAKHVDQGMACQDACMALQQFYKGHPYTVVALADGHGSDKYTRSEIGAHLAMDAVRKASTQFIFTLVDIKERNPDTWYSQIDLDKEFEDRFIKILIHSWKKFVKDHASENPEEGIDPDSDASLNRYGTTVSVCMLYEDRLVAGLIGDGALYCVEKNLNVKKLLSAPINKVGLATDSLISPSARYKWQTYSKVISESFPAMLLMATDGLEDSLEDMNITVRNIFEKTKEKGTEWLINILPVQLEKWSDKGVGDDMSVIVLFFPDTQLVEEIIPES